jgi:hypothetical protein
MKQSARAVRPDEHSGGGRGRIHALDARNIHARLAQTAERELTEGVPAYDSEEPNGDTELSQRKRRVGSVAAKRLLDRFNPGRGIPADMLDRAGEDIDDDVTGDENGAQI